MILGIALLAGWGVAAAVTPAAPAPDRSECPGEAEIGGQLQQRIEQSQTTLEGLKRFVSGMSLGDIPATSLFTVDLADEAAVSRRAEALTHQIASESPAPSVAGLLKCAEPYPAQAERMQALVDLQKGVAQARLDFLSLPSERRATLVNTQQSLLIHKATASELAHEQEQAEQLQSAASRSAESAELLAQSAGTADQRELAAQRALLEKTREDLAGVKIRFSSDLQARARSHQAMAARLSSIAGSFAAGAAANVAQIYAETAVIWRTLVDQVFERIADPQRYEAVPALPAMPASLLARLDKEQSAEDYRLAYRAAQAEHAQLVRLQETLFTEERNNLFRLLLEAGRLRSQLLKENLARGNNAVTALSADYLADIYREVRVVPYRLYAFVITKLIEFRGYASGGIEGIVDIAGQLLIFALFLAIPVVIFQTVQGATARLDRFRERILRDQIRLPEERRRHVRIVTIVIQRLSAYLPWVIMLLGIWAARHLVEDTVFAEVAAVLPYLAYYVWYRIFEIFVTGFLGMVVYTGAIHGFVARRRQLQRMAHKVGAFFFVSFALLHATQDVVGEALVYRLVVAAMIYLGLGIWVIVAHRWRQEILSGAKRVLPAWLAIPIERACTSWLSWVLCLPAMILVIVGVPVAQIRLWAGQTDLFKRIGAELFRRRVESATQGKAGVKDVAPQRLPDDYLEWFDLGAPIDASMLIKPGNGIADEVVAALDAWKRNPAGGHSLAIVGDKGSGKSSLLRVVESECKGFNVVRISIPPKLTTRKSILAFFGENLQCDLGAGANALTAAEQSMEPTVILVDEAHNVFLSEIGGFDGYRALLELVNAGTSKLFWCTTFNLRSWTYLQGVFGDHAFRTVLGIPPLSDGDVQELILTRHKRTGYHLSYDAIIRAAQSPDEFGSMAHIETQFFRLLWGQSKGNPRAAIVLWRSALRSAGRKGLRVGIPYFEQIRGLRDADDEALFVFAAIVRHENLTTDEAVVTTNLEPAVVMGALRLGLEAGAIEQGSDGRLRPSPKGQFALIQLLSGKNLIHE